MRKLGVGDAGRFEPLRPVLPIIEVQQRKFEHVRRLADALSSSEQLGAANRKQLLGAQAGDVQPGPTAIPVPYGKIDVLPGEVDVMQGGGDAQVDAGMRLGKPAKSVDEPFGGEVRRGADGEDTGALALDETLGADRDAIE